MADLNTEIKIGADASGVEAGVTKAKRSLKDLGAAAQQAGKEGGEGIGSIGAGGDKAAEKVERATRNMQNSIQRQIAVMQAGSKESREYWEALASQRGLDANALRPYLDQLQRVTEETNKAKEATDGLMDQAKGLGVVLGTAIAGLMAGFTLDKFIQETIGAQQEQAQLAAVLKSTGEAARFSQKQLNDMADSLSASSVFSGGDINQAQTRLLAYTGIVGKEFPRAMQNVIDMASRMGMSVTSSAETIGRALDVPSEGLTALTRQGFKFSEAQKQLVESLEATGRTGEAQAIIMDALESSYGGAAEAAAGTLGGALAQLQNQIDDLMTGGDGSINGMTAMVKTASGVVGDFAVILDAATKSMSGMENGTGALSTVQESLATFFETIAVLANETIYVLRQTGDTLGGLAAGYKAFFSFDFDAVRAIGKDMKENGEQARREIDATTARIISARKEAALYSSYATRNASAATDPRRIDLGGTTTRTTSGGVSSGTAKAVKETISEYDKLIKKLSDELPKAAAEAEAAQNGYNKAQTEFVALANGPAWAKFTNNQRANVAALFATKITSESAADATKALNKANEDAAKSREKYLTSLDAGLDKIQADTAAQIDATARMGLSKDAIAALDAAKLEMLATDLELQAIKALDRNLDEATYNALKQQAAAYRDLAKAKQGGAAKETALDLEKANADAAKKADEEWRKTADGINQSLTDALLRGFESGKDFAKNLRDTVINMFKTMVLRPVISAIISPVAGALTGALGLSGAARAGQSGGGVGDIISTASNAYNMLNKGVSSGIEAGFSKFATSSAGQSLGLSSAGVAGNNPSAFVGPQLTATGSQMGAALGVVGNTLAGYAMGSMAKSLISGGYSVSGGMETLQKVGTAVGSALGGPVVGAIVGGAAGVVNRLFGRKLKDSGIEGNFGGASGFEGNSYQYLKGGLFRSDKTKRGELDDGLQDYLSQSFKLLQTQTGAFAETLGLQSDKVASFTSAIKLSLKDLDEKEATAALEGAVKQAGNDLAQTVLGGNTFAKAGEEASATLARLAVSLSATNGWLDTLGLTLRETSLASAAASSTFIEMFGSVDAFTASMSSYYENFYSEAEKTANVTRDVAEALAGVGLQMPQTRDEFRAMVEAQMALGESGAKTVSVLLGVSGAFASVTQAATLAQDQAAKAASLDRKDRLAAQRAQEKQAAEALQKQIEAYADGAEQFNVLRDALLKAGDAAGLLAAVTERAFADPVGKMPRWESTDTAASFNYRYGEMQARMRQQLGDEASANALRIENVQGVLQRYSVEQMMSEYDPVTGALKLAVQQGIVDASGDLGFAVRDAVQGAALYAAMADVRGQFTSSGPGLASIAAARATAADASRTSIDPATGLYRIGGAAVEYGKALDNLQGRMRSGAIDADTFERAVEALGAALPGAAESVGTLEDVVSAMQGASYMVGTAGLSSIRHYFGSLSSLTAEFAKAASEAQEPIAQTTAAIGRLNSAQYAFAESATATLQGFGGGGVGGAWMLQDAGVMKDINRAQIIAEAAGIASAAMTTADAAAAAAKLAQSPAFAELTAQGIRDASLLLDGVGEYNADGFERAFIRISDALAKGSVTEDQYKALFDTALDMFEGVPEETRTLIDSMTRLRDAMSGFADGLLIDEQRTTLSAGATLAEMQRQYAQAFAGAATGDNDAIGKYQQLANTLLDKELYSTQAEYNAAFGSVYGDARQLEAIGINTMANAQGNEMVSELKDMNAKLNKRVEDLEKNLLAALAQIAKNTSDTSRGIEQQIVMAEDTP